MDYFNYQDGQFHAEKVALGAIAKKWGTPCYVYSKATLERHWQVFDQAFGVRDHLICYAVKANSNLAVLDVLAKLGSGFDIVSGGELERVLAVGADPKKVVFSGVGKTQAELTQALSAGIACFNVESAAELARLSQVAAKVGKPAPIALRVNPDIDAKTHPYIATGLSENKFGVPIDEAYALYQQAAKNEWLVIKGIDCHIGSQLTEVKPYADAAEKVAALATKLEQAGIDCAHIDMGGGMAAYYHDSDLPQPQEYIDALLTAFTDYQGTLIIEPGRAIAANAGLLLTTVEYLKPTAQKNFAIVDAAMNDLIRPSLYQAWQDVLSVQQREGQTTLYDIVGPICESGDFLAKERALILEAGDLLAIRGAGAYGFVMSSNYNSRPRPAEIMVDGDNAYCVRQREKIADLFWLERGLPGPGEKADALY